jgi:hypothetical protein
VLVLAPELVLTPVHPFSYTLTDTQLLHNQATNIQATAWSGLGAFDVTNPKFSAMRTAD